MQNVKFQIFVRIDSRKRIYFYLYRKYKLLQSVGKLQYYAVYDIESDSFVSLHSWYTKETKGVLKIKYSR